MLQGTAHHVNEQRKLAAVDERIARMKAAAGALSAAQLAGHAAAMEGEPQLGPYWACGSVGGRAVAFLGLRSH